jgi:hypothetical protein
VFVANELDNSVSVCRWDAAQRLLAVTSSLPLLPLSCKQQVPAAALLPPPASHSNTSACSAQRPQ